MLGWPKKGQSKYSDPKITSLSDVLTYANQKFGECFFAIAYYNRKRQLAFRLIFCRLNQENGELNNQFNVPDSQHFGAFCLQMNQLSEHAGFASPLPFLQRQRELPAGDKLRWGWAAGLHAPADASQERAFWKMLKMTHNSQSLMCIFIQPELTSIRVTEQRWELKHLKWH